MPLSRRQIYRRRRATVFGGAALVLGALLYLPMTLMAPLAPATSQVLTYAAPSQHAAELKFPGYGASALGAVGFSGILAHSGDDKPRSIASISKVITSLVVLAKKPLAVGADGPTLTMTAKDEAYYTEALKLNGKVEPVRAGVKLTQLQVLNLVLVSSANNYAETLVDWAFGSSNAFLASAKAWLSAHGLTQTTMLDPSGLDPGNTSTTGDLIELGKIALQDPLISKIIATKSVQIPGVGVIDNTNELLGIDGVDGIKTGTLDEAGACLLFSAVVAVGQQSVTVVGVVLGGKDHVSLNRDIQTLLKSAAGGFHEVILAATGQPFVDYRTEWGQSAKAVAATDQTVVVWADTPITARVSSRPVRFASSGEKVGQVSFSVGSKEVTVPLTIDTTVEDPGPWWRLTNPLALVG